MNTIDILIKESYTYQLNCWFRKKKKKHYYKEPDYYKEEPKIIYAVPNVLSVHDFSKFTRQNRRRNSDLINPTTVYLVADPDTERKIKSYPTSPVRTTRESRQEIPQRSVPVVVVGSPPRQSSLRVPQSPPPQEPFPFQIPKPEETLPRRSSLFHGITNIKDLPEEPKATAENPIEDTLPIVQEEPNPEKHVTIKLPGNNMTEQVSDVGEPVRRTTVVRLRPSSAAQTPGEYVKQMTVRASVTEPPASPGRLVMNMPVKPIKDAPLLITSDGKKLKPVGADKIRTSIVKDPVRTSVARQSFTKENGLRSSQVMRPLTEQVVCAVPVIPARRTSVSRDEPIRRASIAREEPPRRTSIKREGRKSIPRDEPPRRTSIKREERKSIPRDETPRRTSIKREERKSIPRDETHKRTSIMREGRISMTRGDQNVIERRGSIPGKDGSSFPLNQNKQSPVVYAVPTIPTRGRSRSILQQSVKSLTARDPGEVSSIHKKNIRRSMDTDVFSTQLQRRSVQRNQPGYVNMERGQTVLVSELLNPISSIFVTDLKDPVPKDPQNRPREYNNLVRPNQQSAAKLAQPERKRSIKAPVVVYQDPKPKQTRGGRYRNDTSSSEESIEVYRKKSKHAQRQPQSRYAVYSTHVGPTILPQETTESGKNPPFKKKGKPTEPLDSASKENDFCGLNIEPAEKFQLRNSYNISRPKLVSSAQQTEEEEEMDLLCYPANQLSKDLPMTTESGSKLRWRIIIKR